MKKITFILLTIAISISSCKHMVPYSNSLKNERGWEAEQLKHIQFYLSHDITLERKLTKGIEEKIHGKVVLKDGVKTEVVYLKQNLPCAYLGETSGGDYVIQCEAGDGNTLNFGVNKLTGKFQLLATEWDDNTGFGSVHYNDLEYFTSVEDGHTFLMIDLRKATHEKNSFHVATGVKVK